MDSNHSQQIDAILDAMLPHVAFDGWSQEAYAAALDDVGIDQATATSLIPRGPVALAIRFHQRGDEAMTAAMAEADLSEMRYSEKVAHAIWLRLQVAEDKEIVRRGTSLFSLPHMAPEGAKLIWGTADKIWAALGDTSDDVNWYTKRATLSGVYGSVVLFWLGDNSENHEATRAFIDRRIANVMQFEKFKADVRKNPSLQPFAMAVSKMFSHVKAPDTTPRDDLPGSWRG